MLRAGGREPSVAEWAAEREKLQGEVARAEEARAFRTGVERLLRRKLTQVIDCRLEKQRGSPARGRRFALDRGAEPPFLAVPRLAER